MNKIILISITFMIYTLYMDYYTVREGGNRGKIMDALFRKMEGFNNFLETDEKKKNI